MDPQFAQATNVLAAMNHANNAESSSTYGGESSGACGGESSGNNGASGSGETNGTVELEKTKAKPKAKGKLFSI